jgi:hypothetical protein
VEMAPSPCQRPVNFRWMRQSVDLRSPSSRSADSRGTMGSIGSRPHKSAAWTIAVRQSEVTG